VKELQSLALAVEVINEEDRTVKARRESDTTELENGPEVIEVAPNIGNQFSDEESETEHGLEGKRIDEIDEQVSISPNVKEDIKEEGVEKDSA
jgi:hypothetical protein